MATAEDRPLISDLAEALLRDYTINRRRSLGTVRARWEIHLKPYFERFEAEALTTDHIEAYVTRRLAEKAAPATINRELAALKRLYTLAVPRPAGHISSFPSSPRCGIRKNYNLKENNEDPSMPY
jgi:site-specific recombinase XerD